jgi:succinate dehydrogenase / fumarate reductase, cytochrome b subunit
MADALERSPTSEPVALFGGVLRFAMSSVGSKVVMALTGVGLWAFIVGHMAGNLNMWAGPDAMNNYAATLAANPALVWFARIALLVGLPLHVLAAIRSTRMNQIARPTGYVRGVKTPASLGSRTMMISGLMVLAFVVYHLAHFTLHLTNPGHVSSLTNGSVDVYSMVYRSFSVPWISGVYIVAQVLLAEHLAHGLSSLFFHLGLWGAAWSPFIRKAARVVAYVICLGFISVPIGVLLHLVKPS